MSELSPEGMRSREVKVHAPSLEGHLAFVGKSVWQGRDLSEDRRSEMQNSFQESFAALPKEQQKMISLELEALGAEMGAIGSLNEGVAIVRRSEIVSRIRDVMERSGIVESIQTGGVERLKGQVAQSAQAAVAYLGENEVLLTSELDGGGRAGYLLAIVSGIKNELERLKLADMSLIQSQGELQRERTSYRPMVTSIATLDHKLSTAIELEGAIGFTTLSKLIKEFIRAHRE